MGVFQVQLEIGDPQGDRYEPIQALADSGAAYTIIPASILRSLGIVPHDSRAFQLADGTIIRRDFG